jgi:hypothetical protein
MRQQSELTGMWSNITDEDIARANADVDLGMGEMGGAMGGMELPGLGSLSGPLAGQGQGAVPGSDINVGTKAPALAPGSLAHLVKDADWKESEHPRGGNPENSSWFSETEGSGGGSSGEESGNEEKESKESSEENGGSGGETKSGEDLPEGYEDDILIGRSLGARAMNYEVYDPVSGRRFNFVEGSRLQDVEVFAGYKGADPLEEETVNGLVEEFGGDPAKWQHVKALGVLDIDGEEIKAKVHWFQEESVGRIKFIAKEIKYDES